ncbi:coiled-coil domain-containing protein 63-like [Dreissena polymorpha]|uniref:ODAD1 central coiled coil region domain-containing protein n=1 Tax=Dreissena polymorpha TaxID=45954 RepID=A0A9D4LH47_DREPO|nr:coiled-coil domain-containing protein 63-like [Dreissena polymorpha]KAH3857694.1 hypothetical protein DPMN_100306 [Dreissena polymorpha]
MWKKYNKIAGGGATMPTNAVQTAKRSVSGDHDDLDESQLEQELCRLQRQLHAMEGDRRAYSEETCNLLRKQKSEIASLKKENEEIGKVLRLAKSDRNVSADGRDIEKLLTLIDQLDEYKTKCVREEREIKQLDSEIARVQDMINEEQKLMGSVTEETASIIVSKRLRITENRLNQELMKFNNQLATNARLREELDHLRQEKAVFDSLHKRLTKRLEDTKHQISDCIAQASSAYEERDEAQTKMIALKERSDKDMAQQEMEMKELLRIIKHDDMLKEFMGVKAQDRHDFREEESAKRLKGKDTADHETDVEKQTIRQLEKAFERVTDATGESDITTIVNNFIRKEDENFALYNYVNELNDALEAIQEETANTQEEIKRFHDENIKSEDNRRKMIREMELEAERFVREADDAEQQNTVVCKVLDEMRVGVEKLFKEADCDSSTISDMLGSDEGVTNKNILQYMGIIEQRTMELLKLQQYIQMQKEPPKTERKDSKGQPATTPSQQNKKSPRQSLVVIAPPNPNEEDELTADGELRPLTRDELKRLVMHNLTVRPPPSVDARKKSPPKRNKTSPRPSKPAQLL